MEFKPGAYQKGDIVIVNGVQYIADRDILNASAIPKENMYWSKVPEPTPAPIPAVPSVGLSPSNTPEQNSLAIENILAAIPEGGCKSIYIPAGNYRFARTIHIYRRPVYLYGDSGTIWGNSTKLFFPKNTLGIHIDRGGQSIQETTLERLCVIAEGKGILQDGIATNARVKIRDCTVKGFANNGFGVWSNLSEGGDASGSRFDGCHSLENGNDGFFAGRMDANCILFTNCDARDNGRHGFNDDSFLGNNYVSCMCHYNKAGDFAVRDWGNARSGFQFCYTESGNAVSSLGPLSNVIGGLWGSGYNKNDGKGIIYT